MEDRRRPDTVQLERVAGVVVGGAEACRQVPLVKAALVGVGTGVEAVAQAVLRVQRKGLAERVLQF